MFERKMQKMRWKMKVSLSQVIDRKIKSIRWALRKRVKAGERNLQQFACVRLNI
jgi:hypothetical protein